MKKRRLSIIAILALCLALLPVTVLAEDTVDYGVTVNGVQVTSANTGDVLGNGKVSYNADTNTLTINGILSGGTAISGNGTTDVVIDGGNGMAVTGALTVTGAKDVTVTANSFSPALDNGAIINCSGNVEITSQGSNDAVSGALTVTGAQNVTVTANSGNGAISRRADIDCSGDVKITNGGSGYAVRDLTVTRAQNVTVTANNDRTAISRNYDTGVGANITCSGDVNIANNGNGNATDGTLTVNSARNVTVTANGNSPAIIGAADITCSGNVTLTNKGKSQVAASTLTVNGAQDVKVTANTNSPTIVGATNLTCSGDVEITNRLGVALNSFLTVNGAKDVTISAGETASYEVDIAVYKATISCSGDVSITNSHGKIALTGLTVSGAQNVTVTANTTWSAIYGAVSITCSGAVQLVNEESGKVVNDTLTFNQLCGDAYTVSSGSSLSDLTILGAQEAGTTFGPEAIDAQAVRIVPIHALTKTEAKAATCTEDGNTEYWTCSACHKLFRDENGTTETTLADVTLKATGHTLTKTEARDASCTEDGNTEYWSCSACGKYFSDEDGTAEIGKDSWVIQAAHTLTKTEARAATCTEDGSAEYWSCSVCGKYFSDEDGTAEIEKDSWVIQAAHKLTKTEAKAATVTENGNIEYWHCEDCGKYFSDENGANEIALSDTVTAKLPPEIIDGKGQSITAGEKKALTFRSNAAFGDFIRVELDGKTLDEKNYTVKEGSTVVTLMADFAATLSAGEHTIGIVSQSGTASTAFTVNAKASSPGTNTPGTGDRSQMALWIALLFAGGAGVMVITFTARKKSVIN